MFSNSRYPKAERIFFGIMAAIAVLGLIGIGVAANIQSWPNSTGAVVAAIDDNGGFTVSGSGSINLSGSGAVNTYTASSGSATALTAGTLSVIQTFAGSNCKEVIISATALTSSGNTVLVWSPSFSSIPAAFSSLQLSSTKTGFSSAGGTGGIMTSLTAAGGTISATSVTGSGTIVVRGY